MEGGGEKLLLLIFLSSEFSSDLVVLLNVNAAKSKHERLHAGKTLYKFIFLIVTTHFVILKYYNNGTFRKIPETMSLVEMRLFQNNLSTEWRGGTLLPTSSTEILSGLRESSFCDSQQPAELATRMEETYKVPFNVVLTINQEMTYNLMI